MTAALIGTGVIALCVGIVIGFFIGVCVKMAAATKAEIEG